MKIMIVVLFIFFGAVGIYFITAPAKCAWCPSLKCLTSDICGGGCAWVKFGSDMWGSCVSFSR